MQAKTKVIGKLAMVIGNEKRVQAIVNTTGDRIAAAGIETSTYAMHLEYPRDMVVVRLRCTSEEYAVAKALFALEVSRHKHFEEMENDRVMIESLRGR